MLVFAVVYDDALTDAFFSCLVYLHSMIDKPPAIIISLERRCDHLWFDSYGYKDNLSFYRVNFSLEEMAVASPYYRHFRTCLDLSYPTSTGEMLKFQAQQISTDFPQYSDYDRIKELVRNNSVMLQNS